MQLGRIIVRVMSMFNCSFSKPKSPNFRTLNAMREAKNNDGETVSLDEFLKEGKPSV